MFRHCNKVNKGTIIILTPWTSPALLVGTAVWVAMKLKLQDCLINPMQGGPTECWFELVKRRLIHRFLKWVLKPEPPGRGRKGVAKFVAVCELLNTDNPKLCCF